MTGNFLTDTLSNVTEANVTEANVTEANVTEANVTEANVTEANGGDLDSTWVAKPEVHAEVQNTS